jgi:hypothetical protein
MAVVSSAGWTTATIASIGTTTGSPNLTGFVGLTINALAGTYVSGSGIPAGAYILSNTATAAVLSANATGTATITLTLDYSIAEAQVANLALARIGADPIVNTTEDTPSIRQVKAIFATTRDELLRNYEFNFAQKYIELSEDATVTDALIGEWEYAYTIPTSTNIVKILEIDGNKDNIYEVLGSGVDRKLYCNIITTLATASPVAPNKLSIKYVEQIVNPTLWDVLFKDALVLRLASKLAIPLAKRPDLMQVLQSEFASIFNLAANASSKERQIDEASELWTDTGRGTTTRGTY